VTVLSGRTERTVALVGHEPHLPSLASLLCTGSEGGLRLRLKKGGVVLLRFDGHVAPVARSSAGL
jgi:phosphohistidine phosphatase SixA